MQLMDEKQTYDELLAFKVEKGLREKGLWDKPEYRERMQYELGIISQMKFSPYFLIVCDLCSFMRRQGIRFLVRGSGCGSLCVYALRISHDWLDPLELKLPFERFLNPHRVSNPDLDIDIQDDRRAEVRLYTREKYGADHVCRIGNFGTLKPKAATQDVCRALQLEDYQLVSAGISSLIPNGPNVKLDDELKNNEALREKEREYPEVFEWARKLEGQVRQAGVHAAGTIIAPESLTHYVPLWINRTKDSSDDDEDGNGIPVSQWDMYDVEEAGLLKMDYLGLKTLRVVDQASKLINQHLAAQGKPADFDIDKIDRYDRPTWELLSRGELAGVFQVEKQFVRNFAKRMNLNRQKLDPWQLAVLISIIRPGMMDTGATESYLRRASGEEEATPIIPKLAELGTLNQTYQLLTFQEDCMWVAVHLAGFSLAEADNLRRAISKKKKKDMDKIQPKFIEGCVSHGKVTTGDAQTVWDNMATFARYGFNNAHAAAYGCVLLYQTAYLKAHHPLEFMTCLVNSEAGSSSKEQGYNFKVAEYIEEARGMGIKVVKPSVRTSGVGCTADYGSKSIKFGLGLIKYVSTSTVEWIDQYCRTAVSIKDFLLRCFEVVDTGEPRTTTRKKLSESDLRQIMDEQRFVAQEEGGITYRTGYTKHRVVGHLSSKDLEGLIWSGALDVFGNDDSGYRAALTAEAPDILELAHKYHAAVAAEREGRSPKITSEQWRQKLDEYELDESKIADIPLQQLIDREHEVTGCYLTHSPFTPHLHWERTHNMQRWGDLEDVHDAVVLGYLKQMRIVVCKKGKSAGQNMAFCVFRLIGGELELPIFPKAWANIIKIKESDGEPMPLKIGQVYSLEIARGYDQGFHCTRMIRLSR